MKNEFCNFYHIDNGASSCWVLYEIHKDKHLVRKCMCDGDKKRCDFNKIGGKVCRKTSTQKN
ncbi:MAG: hypothetical protein KBS99_07395 [Prevotellaceae bacterium]|nr:hypothetical protein [Candidatus Colivivens caballi]